jgi:hypothetical protein
MHFFKQDMDRFMSYQTNHFLNSTNRLKTIIVSLILLSCSGLTNAYTNANGIAVQGVLVTGGNLAIGLVDYAPNTELGFTIGASWNNKSQATQLVIPALFGGFRQQILDHTYFAFGLDLVTKFGTVNGQHVDAAISAGPYISLEQSLSSRVLLVGFIQPYSIDYEKLAHSSSTTQHFFSTGGIALSYIFSC